MSAGAVCAIDLETLRASISACHGLRQNVIVTDDAEALERARRAAEAVLSEARLRASGFDGRLELRLTWEVWECRPGEIYASGAVHLLVPTVRLPLPLDDPSQIEAEGGFAPAWQVSPWAPPERYLLRGPAGSGVLPGACGFAGLPGHREPRWIDWVAAAPRVTFLLRARHDAVLVIAHEPDFLETAAAQLDPARLGPVVFSPSD